MKRIVIFCLLVSACAASGPKKEVEKNSAQFPNNKQFVEPVDQVKWAAIRLLEQMTRASQPVAIGSVQASDSWAESPWIRGNSKTKFLRWTQDGLPKRLAIPIRQRIRIHFSPSVGGTSVVFDVREEAMQLDPESSKELGWETETVDTQFYDELTRKLKEQLRRR